MSIPFNDLIRKRAAELMKNAPAAPPNWDERKAWWLGQIGVLYELIRSALRTSIDDGLIGYTPGKTTLFESQFGSYEVPTLTLTLVDDKMEITPVASMVLGAFGRVDVKGPAGDVMLVLASESDSGDAVVRRQASKWFLTYPDSRTQVTQLSEGLFQQVFADLMRLSSQ